jgi:Ca2+-binding EF-hand superfamily protein
MRKLVSWTLAALFATVVSVAPAAAQEKKAPDPEAAFKRLDKNSDGKLTAEEFVAKRTGDKAEMAKKAFARLDKNSDGSLSLEEFKARGKKADKK